MTNMIILTKMMSLLTSNLSNVRNWLLIQWLQSLTILGLQCPFWLSIFLSSYFTACLYHIYILFRFTYCEFRNKCPIQNGASRSSQTRRDSSIEIFWNQRGKYSCQKNFRSLFRICQVFHFRLSQWNVFSKYIKISFSDGILK